MNTQDPASGASSPTSSVRLPKTWPYEVKVGDSKVVIYRTNNTVRGKPYKTFTLSYFAGGGRQRKQFTDFGRAKKEAETIAAQKAQGSLGAAALTADARVGLESALRLLAEKEGTGNATVGRLVGIVQDYTVARAELPEGASLVEAAQFYAQRHPSNMQRRTVGETAAEFIADRRSAGCSEIHLRDLQIRLGKQFTAAFAVPINCVSAAAVQQWIYGLTNQKTKAPATARTKENMLRLVVALFNFARRMKYVTPDLSLEVSEIQAPKKVHSPIGIYHPSDLAAILAAADEEVVPALTISAFAGLRLAEVSRLDWREIKLAERQIVIEARNAKTAARRLVPISDNLAAWLAPYVRTFGPVSPCRESEIAVGNALGDRLERAAVRAKVPWKRNGFRHSYISYRVATLKNVPEVALECGNSPSVIFSNYRALATEAEGKAWFAIVPSIQPCNDLVTILDRIGDEGDFAAFQNDIARLTTFYSSGGR